MTTGERLVRTEFNPSQSDIVSQIKQKSAELINLCISIHKINNEKRTNILDIVENQTREKRDELDRQLDDSTRLMDKAIDRYEEAAMWAVKAATVTIK